MPKDSMPKEDILPKDFMPKVKICSNAWQAFSGLKSAICIFQQNLSKIIGLHFVSLGKGDVSLMIICHLGQNDLLGMLSSRA